MNDSLLVKALRCEPVDRPPIWLMRQAGRYMPEYRKLRESRSFLELCSSPKFCADVMEKAVERLDVDAAIVFSDLLPMLIPMGFRLEYLPGDGPRIANPFYDAMDLDRVVELEDASEMNYVYEAVSQTCRAVAPLPVIGFAGAPFTLAGYAIEGGTSRVFQRTKTFMRDDPDAWFELTSRLARSSARYLNGQIAAGASAVQIFDSWIGCLSVEDFRKYAFPSLRILVDMLDPSVPSIYFGTGNPALLDVFGEVGASCVGVDWRVSISEAWRRVGYTSAIQGNLDPTTLLCNQGTIRREAEEILRQVGNRPGFVFNLGHGVLKDTPVENAQFLVKVVKEWSVR